MKVVFQISVHDPWLVEDTRIPGTCFDNKAAAEAMLDKKGFRFFPDAGIWHNGRTEAWIITRPLNPVLGVEEVQLR